MIDYDIKYYKDSNFKNEVFLMKILFLLLLFSVKIASQQLLGVDEINFKHKDKKSFDDAILSDAVSISKADVYSRKIIESDIAKLKKFYFDNGFFDTVVDTAISIDYENEEASVTFIITENRKYRIDSIVISGIDKVPAETIAKIKKIKTLKKNDYYNRALIIQHQSEIIDTLQNNGFMNARLSLDSGTIITRHKREGMVNVKFNLEAADSIYYFGKTTMNIKNNKYGVSEKMLREEIIYKEGELYSKVKKQASERNMTKIPIISSAKINVGSIQNDKKVNFNTEVVLNKKNELSPYIKGSNFENRFYLGGGIKYLDKAFFSDKRTLSLELDEDFNSGNINRTELSATITEPYFIIRKITLINKLGIGFNNLENYKNYFLSNLTTLNYFIAPYTFYNNIYFDLSEELIWIKYDTIATGRQTQINSFLSFTIEHDNTNNVLTPSSGFYHSMLVGTSGLLPKLITSITSKEIFYSQFFKAYTLNKFYFSLDKKANNIFATDIKIGDIIEYGAGEKIIPAQPQYKFFSGGSSSVRGWNAKENGMLDNKLDGGTFLVEGSFELRKKLFPDKEGFMKNLGAAFFLDYGNVWETHKNFHFSEIALAIGFGIRYYLFIGPIRFDFGFKLYDPSQPEGNKWLFENFGEIFKSKFALQFAIGEAF